MARLRTIKPGFFLDEDLAECQPLARLLFAGLWCIADREGRLEDRPRRIKVEVLPYDDCDCDALLGELEAHGFIVRYEAAGSRYIVVPTFARHQNPHCKEAASTIPPPPENPAKSSGAPDKHGACTGQEPDEPGRSCLGSCLGSGLSPLAAADATADANDDDSASESATRTSYSHDFEEWWSVYGRVGSKADAALLYRHWRERGASEDELLAAATAYRAHCEATGTKMQHGRSFLAKKPCRWSEWADGEPHSSMDVYDDRRLYDVMTTAAEAFGLTEGRPNGNGSRDALRHRVAPLQLDAGEKGPV